MNDSAHRAQVRDVLEWAALVGKWNVSSWRTDVSYTAKVWWNILYFISNLSHQYVHVHKSNFCITTPSFKVPQHVKDVHQTLKLFFRNVLTLKFKVMNCTCDVCCALLHEWNVLHYHISVWILMCLRTAVKDRKTNTTEPHLYFHVLKWPDSNTNSAY